MRLAQSLTSGVGTGLLDVKNARQEKWGRNPKVGTGGVPTYKSAYVNGKPTARAWETMRVDMQRNHVRGSKNYMR